MSPSWLLGKWSKTVRTDGRTDGRTDERTNGRTDGRTDGQTHIDFGNPLHNKPFGQLDHTLLARCGPAGTDTNNCMDLRSLKWNLFGRLSQMATLFCSSESPVYERFEIITQKISSGKSSVRFDWFGIVALKISSRRSNLRFDWFEVCFQALLVLNLPNSCSDPKFSLFVIFLENTPKNLDKFWSILTICSQ